MAEDVKQRSLKQNSSAHLWFTHVADELNSAGMDMQVVLSKRLGIMWTPEAVKECLFKVLAKAMYNKDSTTKLTTKEFSKVTEQLQAVLAKDYGVNVDVPSVETQIAKERVWR